MFLKRTTLLLLVISLLQWVLPILSYSETAQPKPLQGILLSSEAAQKLTKRLDYCLQTDKLVIILEAEKFELQSQITLRDAKIVNLNLNVDEYKKETAGFKKAYLEKNDQLVKAQESIPSRATWFGIGAGTMGVIAIVMSVLLAR